MSILHQIFIKKEKLQYNAHIGLNIHFETSVQNIDIVSNIASQSVGHYRDCHPTPPFNRQVTPIQEKIWYPYLFWPFTCFGRVINS